MIRAVLAGVLISGCATAAKPPTLADFTPDLLCYVWMASPLEVERTNVGNELLRRGHGCTQEDLTRGQAAYLHWQQIQQARAQQNAAKSRAFGDALIGLGAAAIVTTPPAPTRCTTQYIGSRAETVCR